MTIQKFIDKAVEGGWFPKDTEGCSSCDCDYCMYMIVVPTHELERVTFFLDPRAWQAVAKAEGWKDGYEKKHIEFPPEWKNNMHNMIDELIEGGTIEKYIKTL